MTDFKKHLMGTTHLNGFEKHNIPHLSASSINSFVSNPPLWIQERLLKKWSKPGPMAFRGSAVEDGVTEGLHTLDADVSRCVEVALSSFDEKIGLDVNDKAQKERGLIPGYVTEALKELRQYGTPSRVQDFITVEIEGVAVPFKGYTDYVFDNHGLIIDLKTTARLPSSISDGHARQGALYAKAMGGNYGMRFAYAKHAPGKDGVSSRVYELDAQAITTALAEIREIATRMERFLNLSNDPEELAALVVPDYSHFFWTPENRAEARSVFGF